MALAATELLFGKGRGAGRLDAVAAGGREFAGAADRRQRQDRDRRARRRPVDRNAQIAPLHLDRRARRRGPDRGRAPDRHRAREQRQPGLVVQYRVDAAPKGEVSMGVKAGTAATNVPVTTALRAAPIGAWHTLSVPLRCLAKNGVDPRGVTTPFVLRSTGALADLDLGGPLRDGGRGCRRL
ncbi:putative glycoside hydrolase [Sphingomonas sp. MMS24-JH45]